MTERSHESRQDLQWDVPGIIVDVEEFLECYRQAQKFASSGAYSQFDGDLAGVAYQEWQHRKFAKRQDQQRGRFFPWRSILSDNQHLIYPSLGIVGSFVIEAGLSLLTGVRLGADPNIRMLASAVGIGCGILWGARRYLEGMNG